MSAKEYEIRTTQLTVVPDGEPIFSEMATVVEITDEAAGEYVSVTQHIDKGNTIKVTPEEWPAIKDAIEQLLEKCRAEKEGAA